MTSLYRGGPSFSSGTHIPGVNDNYRYEPVVDEHKYVLTQSCALVSILIYSQQTTHHMTMINADINSVDLSLSFNQYIISNLKSCTNDCT